ncbi:hypothetical protein ACFX13_014944 [Malus domestica]
MSVDDHSLFMIMHPFWDSEIGLKFYANVFRLCKDQTNRLLSLHRKSYLPFVFMSALDNYTATGQLKFKKFLKKRRYRRRFIKCFYEFLKGQMTMYMRHFTKPTDPVIGILNTH